MILSEDLLRWSLAGLSCRCFANRLYVYTVIKVVIYVPSSAHTGVSGMSKVLALDTLLQQNKVWRASSAGSATAVQPTGHARLDALLPGGGWPEAALSELLLRADGSGELHVLWPTLARLSGAGERIVLVEPPFIPYAPAWSAAGVDLRLLTIVRCANVKDALWAMEQCLRSGSCGAVLGWAQRSGDRELRRLQVAAASGKTLGFICRPLSAANNPSPAALRLMVEDSTPQVRVLKSRGGLAPVGLVPLNGVG